MEELRSYQVNLFDQVTDKFYRSLYETVSWDQRMIAIKGLRGVGKTTLLLQYLKYQLQAGDNALYATLDHPWFYTHSLYELAETFHTLGGQYLLLDEIHKYPQWSRELKVIYDGFPKLKVVFTASSALDIYRGESDLSRRVLTYELTGLSFREFLLLDKNIDLPKLHLDDILNNHRNIAIEISENLKPIPLFKEYLQRGYLPITTEGTLSTYIPKVQGIINNVMEFDLSFIEGYSTASQVKIKKLLGIIAESVPFEPNISSLARKMNLGRETINSFLQHLFQGRIVNLLKKQSKGIAALQKPDKIYLENTNFNYALNSRPDMGTLRETFLLNQLRNMGKHIELPVKGDFFVTEDELYLEVGGKSKSIDQVSEFDRAIVAADDIEYGFDRKIPLWLFGFLY